MSKDNNIDDLFSDKMENEIKREIKKKRSRLNLILIIISVVSTITIIIIGNRIFNFQSDKYIEKSQSKEEEEQYLEYSIMYPNEYIGKVIHQEKGYFAYESTYDIGRRIGGKSIFAGSITNSSNGLYRRGYSAEGGYIPGNGSLDSDINKRYSNVYGLRKLSFLYPYVHYTERIRDFNADENKTTEDNLLTSEETIINDFHFLNEINDNKIIEMALSFDKEYTYEEVNSMLDRNLITFCWVDSNSEKTKQQLITVKLPALNGVIGIKSIDASGELKSDLDDRIESFKTAVKQLKDMGDTRHIENIDDNSIQNIDEDNIKIIGAVVVGSPKELKNIQNNPMIKHAVLGTVVDKY